HLVGGGCLVATARGACSCSPSRRASLPVTAKTGTRETRRSAAHKTATAGWMSTAARAEPPVLVEPGVLLARPVLARPVPARPVGAAESLGAGASRPPRARAAARWC